MIPRLPILLHLRALALRSWREASAANDVAREQRYDRELAMLDRCIAREG